MCWIDAEMRAAKMVKHETSGNLPNAELIGQSVRENFNAAPHRSSVASFVSVSGPNPAILRLVDLAPERINSVLFILGRHESMIAR